MRIAVTSALSWPYVRRGNRCAFELAAWLARRGHEVTFITPAPGRRRRVLEEDGVRIERIPLPDSLALTALKIQKLAAFAVLCRRALDRGGYDVVQATYPIDAAAAAAHRARGGAPCVYMLYDCLPFHPEFLFGRTMFRRGIAAASRVTAISAFVAGELRREYAQEAEVVPLATDLARFAAGGPKPPGPPVILCTASLHDPRKRVDLLVRAFDALHARRPDARLRLCGPSDAETDRRLLALVRPGARAAIDIPGVGRREDLPARYREATISVLPSVNEAFGLVVTESLASGTPVVATASGAIPEILDDPGVGVLFDAGAGPAEVARALERGLDLAADPETPARCRRHVEARYTWDRIGGRYEEIYREILGNGGGRAARAPAAPPDAGRRAGTSAASFDEALDRLETDQDTWFRLERWRPGALRLLEEARRRRPPPARAACLGLAAAPAVETALRALGYDVVGGEDAQPPVDLVFAGPPGTAAGDLRDLVDAAARACRTGGVLLLLADARSPGGGNTPELRSRLAAAGFDLLACRRTSALAPVLRSFGSTPVKTALRARARAVAHALVPPWRGHLFAIARRADDRARAGGSSP